MSRIARAVMTALTTTAGMALTASPANADEDIGFYAGGSVSNVQLDETFDDGIGIDDDTTGFRLLGGYQFSRYLAIELGYIDFGEFDESLSVAGSMVDLEAEVDGFDASIVGRLPVTDAFTLTGRVGGIAWDAEAEVRVDGMVDSTDSDDGTDLFYGLGAEYQFGDRFSMFGGFDRYEIDQADLDVFMLGGKFHF